MTRIGYETVQGEGGKVRGLWSFRIFLCGQPVKDAQTPLWFPDTDRGKQACRECAEQYMQELAKHLVKRLKCRKNKVRIFTT